MHSARHAEATHERRVRPARRRLRVWLAGIVLVALVVDCFVVGRAYPALRHSVWHQISISVMRKHVSYDALYFTKPLALPSRIPVGTPSEFSFALKRQGSRAKVGYTVVLTDARGTLRLSRRSIWVDAERPSVIQENFQVPVAGPFEVGVNLSSQKTAIAFHGRAS
jgi:hypothetical protein